MFSSREPDSPSHQNSRSTFQKPNLPPLQGTPSSKRQYSYGADVEPMPSRPGHGLQRTQVRDISSAVRSALTRHEAEEDEHEKSKNPTFQKQSEQQTADALPQGKYRPSYLSGPSGLEGLTRSQLSPRRHDSEGSETDDVRSFGIESDFYGDATIDSTPGAPLDPQTAQPPPLSQVRTLNNGLSTDALRRSTRHKQHDLGNENHVDLVRQPIQNRPMGLAKYTIGPSPLRASPRAVSQEGEDEQETVEKDDGPQEPDADYLATIDDEWDREQDHNDEEEVVVDDGRLTKPHNLRHMTNTNTNTRESTRRQLSPENVPQKTRMLGPLPALPPPKHTQHIPRSQPVASDAESFVQTNHSRPVQAPGLLKAHQRLDGRMAEDQDSLSEAETSQDSSESGRWLTRGTTSNFSSLFAQAKNLAKSSPFGNSKRYPADEDEREAAIQRDIDDVEAELARAQRLQASEESRQRWQQRWRWIKSFVPFVGQATADSRSEGEMCRSLLSLILYYLNPMTYLRGLALLMDMLLDWITTLVHFITPTRLCESLSSVLEFLPHIIVGLLAFAGAFFIATEVVSRTEGDWMPNAVEISWRTFHDIRHKAYDSIPTVSWSRRHGWTDLSNLWDNDVSDEKNNLNGNGSTNGRIEQFLNRMEEEYLALKRAGQMHDASLEKLEKVVPSIVHMELEDGKPVVSQNFWHALRDLLRADGSFLTLDKMGSEYEVSSERQWRSIASRLVSDPVFSSKLHLAMQDFDSKMSGKMTTFWNTWVKDNDEKIAQMLGSAVDQIKSSGSQKEFEERLTKIVKEQLAQAEDQKGGSQRQGQLVTREEFLRHLRNEFTSHRSEIRAELKELQPQLEQLVQQSVELATQQIPQGLSRADASTLVNGLIRKALADVNLEALARGTIHRHWDSDLRHQVNYFSVGSGATIDGKHSSSTWDPAQTGVITQEEYTAGVRTFKSFPPIAALDAWQDQGDCWCAARSVNHRGNPHGASLAVQLAHRVIPQHIVIEHILPGATTEPNARPKVIEVYAEILDAEVRERVLDFGAAFFPDDETDWNFTPPDYDPRFVKITQFIYEAADLHNGVHVHRLSSELMALGATTDHIIVRAVSNYGAKNHTCFYRVRLYGFNPEVDSWP
ncbi:hypothetical protein E4U25_006113 [Claviceps purpurea]|nr:hypothetical protein E4U25_006113 [Claviceps purpurea]